MLPSAPISRNGNRTQKACRIFLFFLYLSEVLDFNLKIHTHFASRCVICPCWNDRYFEFLPCSSVNAGKIARFILWLWRPLVKLLSSPGVSMSRFECSLGACALGKCCSLNLDTQHFSTRFLEIGSQVALSSTSVGSLMWTPFLGNCHSLSYAMVMEGKADCSSSQKWNKANFFKWIFSPQVLSTLIIPLPFKRNLRSLFHFVLTLFSFSPFLTFFWFFFSLPFLWKYPFHQCSSRILCICS